MARIRRTVLDPIQDVLFTVQFDITEKTRRRMKKFFRSINIDFFALNRKRKELLNTISPIEEWSYIKVGFPRSLNF